MTDKIILLIYGVSVGIVIGRYFLPFMESYKKQRESRRLIRDYEVRCRKYRALHRNINSTLWAVQMARESGIVNDKKSLN